MATASAAAAIMPPDRIKALLAMSKREPVSCVIGMTKDKQGVILLDKKAQPRKLPGQIMKAAAAAKVELDKGSLRFGTASVDTDTDSSLVQFKVNKAAAGALRPLLLESLKRAGFGKCDIAVDDSLDQEEEEGHPAEPAPDRSAGQAAHGAAAGAQATNTAAHGAADAAAVKAAADKAAQVWAGYVKTWQADFAKFESEALAALHGHEGQAEVGAFIKAHVTPILDRIHASGLEKHLGDVSKAAGDGAAQQKLLAAAVAKLRALKDELASHKLLDHLDSNPVHPMKIGQTLPAVLEGLEHSLAKHGGK